MREKSPVVRISRLPPVPPAPDAASEKRQDSFRRLTRTLESAMGRDMEMATANTSRGFPAAAVDLGRLQEELEAGLRRLDMKEVRARWDEDVSKWIVRLLMTWVQRCKIVRFRLRRQGINVHLETQDDRGYYRSEFDVVPRPIF